jgi:hypothetical protein
LQGRAKRRKLVHQDKETIQRDAGSLSASRYRVTYGRGRAKHGFYADESFATDTGAFNRVTASGKAYERNGHIVRKQNTLDYITIVLNVCSRLEIPDRQVRCDPA